MKRSTISGDFDDERQIKRVKQQFYGITLVSRDIIDYIFELFLSCGKKTKKAAKVFHFEFVENITTIMCLDKYYNKHFSNHTLWCDYYSLWSYHKKILISLSSSDKHKKIQKCKKWMLPKFRAKFNQDKFNNLKRKNPHERDRNIKSMFTDEKHIYQVSSKINKNTNYTDAIKEEVDHDDYISVTTFIENVMFKKFDKERVAKNIVARNKRTSASSWSIRHCPNPTYYGMNVDEIIMQWKKIGDEAAQKGTYLHEQIEKYYNKREYDKKASGFKYFRLFENNFIQRNPDLKPYRTEWMIYDEDLKIAGTIDMIYIQKNSSYSTCMKNNSKQQDSYWMVDWKRCKQIKKDDNYGKYGIIESTKCYPDTNFWHYSVQLSLYSYILFTKYNIDTRNNLYIVCLHPNQTNYEFHKISYLDNVISDIKNIRLKQLK